MTNQQTYSITGLTANQLRVLRDACELYGRTHMGQWQEAFLLAPKSAGVIPNQLHKDLKACSLVLSKHLTDEIDGQDRFLGIGHRFIPRQAHAAWDIYQVTRHRISWDCAISKGFVADNTKPRDYSTMLGVNYDTPLRFGFDPLPTIQLG